MEAAAKIPEKNIGETNLVQQLQNYLKLHNLKPSSIASEVGYSRVSITRYLSGTYGSDVSGIERNVARFLSEHTDNIVEIPTAVPKKAQKPRFFESRDAKAVLGVCQSCQEYVSMGVVTASSGLGKTHALREYAKLPHVVYIECGGSMCRSDIVNTIENAIGLPHRRGTVW